VRTTSTFYHQDINKNFRPRFSHSIVIMYAIYRQICASG